MLAPDAYHYLAGHCEQESAIGCIVREAQDEAGLDLDPATLDLIHVVHQIDAPGAQPMIGLFFPARSWRGVPVVREPNRCTSWGWWHSD